MGRHELTDGQFAKPAPYLPPQRPRTGRPAKGHRLVAKGHRLVLEGILWVLRTGAPWRDPPPRYGSWRTVSGRVRRWQQAGAWDRIPAAVQRQADAAGSGGRRTSW